MAMATFTSDAEQVEREFAIVQDTFNTLREQYFASSPSFKEISMGMSHDWHLSVKHGATMVRIGTDIFGEREY